MWQENLDHPVEDNRVKHETAEHEEQYAELQKLFGAMFDMAHHATLSSQQFSILRQILLEDGNQDLADTFAKAYQDGIAAAFDLAVQTAVAYEQAQQFEAATQAWDRAIQLNPEKAEAVRQNASLNPKHADDTKEKFGNLLDILQAALDTAIIGELSEDNFFFLKSIAESNPFMRDLLDSAWNIGMAIRDKKMMQNMDTEQEEMDSTTGDAREINVVINFIRRIESAKQGTLQEREYFNSLNDLLDANADELVNTLRDAWRVGMEHKDHTCVLPVDSCDRVAITMGWPPNKMTSIQDLISLHRSPVPAVEGTFRVWVPSVNLGVLESEVFEDTEKKIEHFPLFVVDMSDALVYKGADFVVDTSHPGGALLYNSTIDSIIHFTDWLQMHDRREPKEAFLLKGSTLLIGGTWEENFAHFVSEVMGRCSTFERFGYAFSDVDTILVSQNISETRWDWFRSVGIADKVKVAPDCFLLCERLLLPSLSPTGVPLETIEYLRKKIAPSCNGKNRIFVSRGNKKNGRNLSNEAVFFDRLLKPVGFERVTMDGMTVKEQADIFFSATHIIAPHGAALSNLIFANAHAKVLEIFGKSYVNPCMFQIANQLHVKHYHIICEELNDRGTLSDFYVDMNKIDLRLFLSES